MADSERGAAELLSALRGLLPTGPVWPRSPGTAQEKVLAGLAEGAARLRTRARSLLTVAFPSTAVEFLPEWEAVLGLPDACSGIAPTQQGRREQVVARLTARGGQSKPYLIGRAAALGFPVTITQFAPFRCGVSAFGDGLCDQEWAFAWRVNAPEQVVREFTFGTGAFGEAIRSWGNAALQCVLGRLAPAHTQLLIAYQVETLVTAGGLMAPLSLARSQPGGALATALGPDGLTWQQSSPSAPRFAGASRRLVIEGERVERIRNPRGEGSTPGTIGAGGAWPANWLTSSTSSPVAYEVLGTGIEDGIDYIDVRISGTPASGSQVTVLFEATTQVAAALGQIWTGSVFARVVAGALPSASNTLRVFERSAVGVALVDGGANIPITSARLGSQRRTVSRTLSNASVAYVTLGLRIAPAVGVPYSCTLRIGWPGLALGIGAGSPALPAVASPGAATRGADIVSASLTSLGLPVPGPCTVLMSAMLPQNAPASADQVLFQIDGGTDADRYRLRNAAGGATIVAGRVTGGASLDAASLGGMVAGTPFRLGVTIDAAGAMRAMLDDGVVQSVAGGPLTGLATLRLGNNAAGTAALMGEVGTVIVLPHALSDADLAARVALLPA